MKIGVDVDGCLANFVKAYEDLFVKVAGVDLFPARWPEVDPPCWDWPQHYGYSNDHAAAVWKLIKADPTFWYNLQPYDWTAAVLKQVQFCGHEVYFVTDRPG